MTARATAPMITPTRLKLAASILITIAAIIVVSGLISRAAHESQLERWTAAQAVPSVSVIEPSTDSGGNSIQLPGRLEAFYRAPIYARVSGYLKAWYVDIGAYVKAGQLLGVIETPDLDQQLVQAKADLASTQANVKLAETTAARWQMMLKSDSVSRQAAEEKNGDLETKQAIANAAAANVERLQALESFKRIVAPFDGVVTSRDTDVGALIDAGGGRGPQLFTVSEIHQLRVYVQVPQFYAPDIHPGMSADLTVPGHSGAKFVAKVDSTSSAISAESGTVLVELSLDDHSGVLLPGDFANVRIKLSSDTSALRLPASSLIFRSAGLQVATVDANDRVSLRTITIQRDLGQWVEVATGIHANDKVVDNPPDALSDGDEVRSLPANENKAPAPQSKPEPGRSAQ